MLIRDAVPSDWPRIWPFWQEIVSAGETYAWDRQTPEDEARRLWMGPSARVFVVEIDSGPTSETGPESRRIVASAYVKPNYGGPAAAVANAGFMVDPAFGGRGVGRRLAEHVLGEAKRDGYRAMVFNAVVATNPAVALWRSLGFTVLGTVPEAFDHPVHGPVGLHIMHRML
ncbi:N-acetyltransferase [Actinoplanes sp. NPDC024001]|uniref:GNAT family N-acetyltransferase n=1 Tax=Actinoplanes sp. NPDC024001 TaxID=3154598 RepID=UPI003409DD0D